MSAYALPGAFPFDALKLRSKSEKGSYQSKTNDENKKFRSAGGIDITVKSAKVNHYLLIQSLTRQKPQTHHTHSEQMLNSLECKEDDDEQWGEYSEAQNTFQEMRIHAIGPEDQVRIKERHDSICSDQKLSSESAKTSSKNESHVDAIEFTLSISSNGRSYTAKRPFTSISKLRDELVNEVTSRCSELEIPELPLLREQPSSNGPHNVAMMNGFAGLGFTNLQAMVCSYSPKIEDWLHIIVHLNPYSQVLAKFLWEPITTNSNKKPTSRENKQDAKCTLRKHPSKQHLMTLDCINEE